MASIRTNDPTLALDVDLLILHYIVHDATDSLLAHHQENVLNLQSQEREISEEDFLPRSLENQLHLVDSFVSLFRLRHPAYQRTEDVAFRLALMRFTVLFTLRSRYTSSTPSDEQLAQLQTRNSTRANAWQERKSALEHVAIKRSNGGEHDGDTESFAFLKAKVEGFFASLTNASPDIQQDQDDDIPILLLHLIPHFVELIWLRICLSQRSPRKSDTFTSAQTAENNQTAEAADFVPQKQLLDLMAMVMSHAVLEAYLHNDSIYRSGCPATLLEAFSWGPWSRETFPEERNLGSNDSEIDFDDVFVISHSTQKDQVTNSEHSEASPWLRIRAKRVRLFVPCDPDTLNCKSYRSYLNQLWENKDEVIGELEHRVHDFLVALQRSTSIPTLAVLEELVANSRDNTGESGVLEEDSPLVIEGMNLTPEEANSLINIWCRTQAHWAEKDGVEE